ncbi:hypothetical protein HPC49_10175 [Pyxidicoccus fallax]|uniref:Uncharacterized protein n=1 Tax=Pyxidicoccus fallax TaxID=394095 RepID=A0A346D7B6_9BACT|nr:hypothetical protein [Pyxidicoccus fallax]AXM42931.1 hypothetical protein [Pyxidicoccus fallax]NMO18042.1 hypothetical protein [Pyxidicoccus fallax]NPC78608.1 hypothetical protein [Pyxidicoccus fallax]
MHSPNTNLVVQTANEKNRGISILASSLFRQLVAHGYTPSHVVNLTTELLDLLSTSLRSAASPAMEPVPIPVRTDSSDTGTTG